ncbi:MAG: 3-deoxy-7-phosphoheptulonate synthase [Acutalibacteraceae bacterium]|nr:3-deoxy-7-phosphoheptulonate synthase [Acutalibacteraceae bacterium]
MGMDFKRKLPIPMDIKKQYPLSKKDKQVKEERDSEIRKIFTGESDKFLLIIGPCSADYPESVLEYIEKLKIIQEQVKDKVFIIPRIYTNKPRTTGAGYKGMLHQPDPDKNPDMLSGIVAIRELHMKALKDYGFTCADEMLYPSNHRYLSDLLSYVAVGARSVENQEHRLVSSGMDTPVGMKNPTGGDLTVMMNAISAAQHGHTFIYRGWEVKSDGNPLAHAILRGYTGPNGSSISNYHYENLSELCELYKKSGLLNPSVIIDTNHANSAKKYAEQPRISKDVIYSCTHNDEIKKLVKGLMVESYLEDGCQKVGEHVYGKSITDPCLGWKKTEKLIYNIADTI